MSTTYTPEQEAELERLKAEGGVDVDEVVGVGERIKPGRATVRLIGGEAKKSQQNKDTVVARFEIQKHEVSSQVGMDYLQFYSLAVTPPKKPGQKPFAPGIVEMRSHAAAVGSPIKGKIPFHLPNDCWKLIAKALGKKEIDVIFYEDISKADPNSPNEARRKESTFTKMKVLGLAGKSSSNGATAATPTSVPAAAEPEDEDLV